MKINPFVKAGIVIACFACVILGVYLFAPNLFHKLWKVIVAIGATTAALFGIPQGPDHGDPQDAADKIIKQIDEHQKTVDQADKKREDLDEKRNHIIDDINNGGGPNP